MDEQQRVDETARAAALVRRWGLPTVGYKELTRRGARQLLDEGRAEELRELARNGPLERLALARFYAERGRIEELRELADLALPRLDIVLSGALAGQDDAEAATAVMKTGLYARDRDARDQLIALLRAQDRVEEAIAVLDVESNEYAEWHLLVHLLLAEGRVGEVRAMTDEGFPAPRRNAIAGIFAELGMVEELRALAAPGCTGEAFMLARTLVRLGRVDEGIAVARQRVAANEEHAFTWLIDLLVEQRRADQAVAALTRRPNRTMNDRESLGDAAFKVARLLDELGRPEDAIRMLQRSYLNLDAAAQLADLLAERGRLDEALDILDRAIRKARYDPPRVERAGQQSDLLVEHGRIDELRSRADGTGSAVPTYRQRLAQYLEERRLFDELRTRHAAGDHFASRSLAELLAREDRVADLEALVAETDDSVPGYILENVRSARDLEIPYQLYLQRRWGREPA